MNKKRKIGMIGNAHLDPSWMWAWQEGSCEAKATIRSALDRIKEFDDFCFACSSASVYKWIEEFDPEMFEEIKKRVSEGRFIITGGWNVQPDCNLPCGEGLVRQGLYSQRYFKEKFGVTAKVGWCVDSFGHSIALPQILKKSGMDSYIYMRPHPFEMPNDKSFFNWTSPDGSSVLTYRIPNTYCHLFETAENLESIVEKLSDLVKEEDYLIFYGVGNHGGGPTIKNINLIHEYSSDKFELSLPNINEYMENYAKTHSDIPVFKEELQHHASGCYSAVSAVKTAIRKSENALLEAEKFNFLANKLIGKNYDTKAFENAWENVCFTHFHDVLGGCCTKSAFDEALPLPSESISFAKKNINNSLQSLSWKINTENAPALPVIIFNPHPFDADCVARINLNAENAVDSDGNSVPTQKVHSETQCCYKRPDTLIKATIPALGYKTFFLTKALDKENKIKSDSLCATSKTLENNFVKITFDEKTASISSYIDKKTGRELLGKNGICALIVDENEHDTWSHKKNYFDKFVGAFENGEITVLEDSGAVRVGVKMVSRYGNSILTQRFYLTENCPELQMECELLWLEKNKMLKFALDTTLTDCICDYHMPFGDIERECNGEEEPGHTFVALKGENGAFAVFNDSKYSYSAKDSTLYLTAIRSPIYGDHGGERTDEVIYTDQGLTSFCYVFKYYEETDKADMTRRAAILNTPPTVVIENNHKGTLPYSYSGISIEGGSVIITALKRSEDGDGDIIRAYECEGRAQTVKINAPCLGMEQELSFTPYEVKTLLKRDGENAFCEVMMTEYQ